MIVFQLLIDFIEYKEMNFPNKSQKNWYLVLMKYTKVSNS